MPLALLSNVKFRWKIFFKFFVLLRMSKLYYHFFKETVDALHTLGGVQTLYRKFQTYVFIICDAFDTPETGFAVAHPIYHYHNFCPTLLSSYNELDKIYFWKHPVHPPPPPLNCLLLTLDLLYVLFRKISLIFNYSHISNKRAGII